MTIIVSPPANTRFAPNQPITIVVIDGPVSDVKVGTTSVGFLETTEIRNGIKHYDIEIEGGISTTGQKTITITGPVGKEPVTLSIEIHNLGPGGPGGPGGPDGP